jgi:hypothetical protein
MKTCLLAVCLIATAASSVVGETYRAPIERTRQKQQRVRPAPPLTRTEVDGVIPRGIRGGNFLQMFNPKAPARYGTSQEAVVFHPRSLGAPFEEEKWKGIKFFVFRF